MSAKAQGEDAEINYLWVLCPRWVEEPSAAGGTSGRKVEERPRP